MIVYMPIYSYYVDKPYDKEYNDINEQGRSPIMKSIMLISVIWWVPTFL